MRRIEECFSSLQKKGRRCYIPYVMAGDPSPGLLAETLHCLANSGADIVEVGVPFSDPMADGPVIQRAAERALAAGMDVLKTFSGIAEFRAKNQRTPLVIMTYCNPIEARGLDFFARQASHVGVDAILAVDLPPEESKSMTAAFECHGLGSIFLISPTTTSVRMKKLAKIAKGFVYYVSLRGVTGANTLDIHEVENRLVQVRESIALPIGVGFGIRDEESAAQVAAVADAVVVGSALVEFHRHFSSSKEHYLERLHAFSSRLSAAVHGVVVS